VIIRFPRWRRHSTCKTSKMAESERRNKHGKKKGIKTSPQAIHTLDTFNFNKTKRGHVKLRKPSTAARSAAHRKNCQNGKKSKFLMSSFESSNFSPTSPAPLPQSRRPGLPFFQRGSKLPLLRPPPRRILPHPRRWRLGIADIRTPNRSCSTRLP